MIYIPERASVSSLTWAELTASLKLLSWGVGALSAVVAEEEKAERLLSIFIKASSTVSAFNSWFTAFDSHQEVGVTRREMEQVRELSQSVSRLENFSPCKDHCAAPSLHT